METAPFLSEHSSFEIEVAIESLETYTLLSIFQVLPEPIQVGSESIRFETRKCINFI
jgi:hypothetical protein